MTGKKAQGIINDFKLNGEQLFYPVLELNPEQSVSHSANENKSFFLNAIISSFNLILSFDQPLFYVVVFRFDAFKLLMNASVPIKR